MEEIGGGHPQNSPPHVPPPAAPLYQQVYLAPQLPPLQYNVPPQVNPPPPIVGQEAGADQAPSDQAPGAA